MLLNHEILEEFTKDIHKEIYGRELKLKISQKTVSNKLNALEKNNVLKSKKRGNIKFYKLNLENKLTKDILTLTEINKKIKFLKKHPVINHILDNDDRVVGIFGSYANNTQKKSSDIDMFIIGKKSKEDYEKKGEIYGINVSIKYFSSEEFEELLKNNNPLINEIVNNHIILFNTEKFIDLWFQSNGV